MLDVVKINFKSFQWASDNLKKDEDFIKQIIKLNPDCFNYIDV